MMKYLLSTISIILMWASMSLATVYYVDTTNGIDTNPGTQTQPWKTISKVNSFRFNSGDQILFKRGGIWRETITKNTPGLTYADYGSGNKPSIRGSNVYNNPDNWINESGNLWYVGSILNDPYVFCHNGALGTRRPTIAGLTAQWDYWFDGINSRLYVYSDVNPAFQASMLEIAVRDMAVSWIGWDDTIVQNIDFRHFRANVLNSWPGAKGWIINGCDFGPTGAYGIQWQGTTESTDITVTNCTFIDWGCRNGQDYAIQLISQSGVSAQADITNCTFIINHSLNTTEICAVMSDIGGWIRVFDNNVCLNNGIWKGSGLVMWRPSVNTTSTSIQGNSFYNMGYQGILVEDLEYNGAHPNISIKYNFINDSNQNDVYDTEALRVRSFSSQCNVTVAYNIINKTFSGSNNHPGIYVKQAEGCMVYNNDVYGADEGILIKNVTENALVLNNIISNNRDHGIQVEDTPTLTSDYNCLYSNAAGNYSGVSASAHDIQSDPKFINAANADFHLQPGSPCIGTGTPLPLAGGLGNDGPSGANRGALGSLKVGRMESILSLLLD